MLAACVPMPKATMNKDGELDLPENYIRPPRQFFCL